MLFFLCETCFHALSFSLAGGGCRRMTHVCARSFLYSALCSAVLSSLLKIFFFIPVQTQLYPGGWDGFGEDGAVHHIPVWDLPEGDPWAVPGHRSSLHHSQLGAGVPDMDWAQRGGVSRQSGQSQNHPGLRDELQRHSGTRINTRWLTHHL